jgi:SRSO17 transposase
MGYEMDAEARGRLDNFFSDIGVALNNKTRRASFAVYAMGLLSCAARKSAEPIAAAAVADPATCEPAHHRLLRFLRDSPWEDRGVRRVATDYAVKAMARQEPIRTWIVDDTGFLKQGTHSVGVQRQYTGSAGKITNCQVAVSLSVATSSAHVPIDFALYLPKSWIYDPERRREAKIPEDVVFKTKLDLALEMIEQAVEDGVPGDILLTDSAYGECHIFREAVRLLGFDYALGIHGTTTMWRLDSRERRCGEAASACDIARDLGPKAFRRITWREGSAAGQRRKLHSRFAFRRVKVAQDDGVEPASHEPLWLIAEWPEGEPAPTKFTLTSLRRSMSKKQLVRLLKERYRTEIVYEEMKGELGLDHFEGRSFPGWQHHVTVALCCYAFIIGERMQHFPPSGRRYRGPRPLSFAA